MLASKAPYLFDILDYTINLKIGEPPSIRL